MTMAHLSAPISGVSQAGEEGIAFPETQPPGAAVPHFGEIRAAAGRSSQDSESIFFPSPFKLPECLNSSATSCGDL